MPFLDHVNMRQGTYESNRSSPDCMRDISTLAQAKTGFALSRFWWAGLIDEASKSTEALFSFFGIIPQLGKRQYSSRLVGSWL